MEAEEKFQLSLPPELFARIDNEDAGKGTGGHGSILKDEGRRTKDEIASRDFVLLTLFFGLRARAAGRYKFRA